MKCWNRSGQNEKARARTLEDETKTFGLVFGYFIYFFLFLFEMISEEHLMCAGRITTLDREILHSFITLFVRANIRYARPLALCAVLCKRVKRPLDKKLIIMDMHGKTPFRFLSNGKRNDDPTHN